MKREPPPTPSPDQLRHLCEFRGYGHLGAPLWFIGLEEGLGRRRDEKFWDALGELSIRATWPNVADARTACESIGERYWTHRRYSQVWRVAAQLALALLERRSDWGEARQAWHAYVVESLGRADGRTFLGELLPFPAANSSDWPYTAVFESRQTYEATVWPMRLTMWRAELSHHRPAIVVAYGKNPDANARFEELFSGRSTELVPGRVSRRVLRSGTRVYRTPFLGDGRYRRTDLNALVEDAQDLAKTLAR